MNQHPRLKRKRMYLCGGTEATHIQNHMHKCQRWDALTEATWQGRSTDCQRGLIELRLGRLRGESREKLEPGSAPQSTQAESEVAGSEEKRSPPPPSFEVAVRMPL